MASQPFVTGPAHIFVGTGSAGAAEYLGTAERGPRPRFNREWEQVMNDLAGTRIPLDVQAMGEWALVVMDLTRWDAAVAAKARSLPDMSATRGTLDGGDLGALMMTEGYAKALWIQYPYQAKSAFTTQPAGYHFFNSWAQGPDEEEPGTKNNRLRLAFYCLPTLTIVAGNYTKAVLYDHSMSGLPSITT